MFHFACWPYINRTVLCPRHKANDETSDWRCSILANNQTHLNTQEGSLNLIFGCTVKWNLHINAEETALEFLFAGICVTYIADAEL